MTRGKKRSICVRLDSVTDSKLVTIKEQNNLNDSDAIRKSINIANDSAEIIALHRVFGSKLVNIIVATNGLEESESKMIIKHEVEEMLCLLAK